MATTFVDYTGDGNATKVFSFASIKEADIKVDVDGVTKTSGNHYNITSYTTTGGGNVVFTSGNIPASPASIRIRRDTDVDAAKATFVAGSSVKAGDLNNNMTQILYAAQEEQNQTVVTSDIKDAAITTAKIQADAVTGAKIVDDAIDSEHYTDGSIDTAHIADANITTAKLADNAVTTAKITDANITTAKLADDAVTTAKITDNNVTTNKIAADAITAAKIGDDVINSEHYAAGSIDTEHIADLNVTTGKIAADAITNAKIADDSIDSEHYVDGSIDTVHIADAQITTAKIADDAVTDAKIAEGTLDGRYYTETELNAGQLDNRYFTETESDARYFKQDSSETIASGATWSGSDSYIATTAAIDARIIDLVDDVGGFVPLASETAFPTANPDVNNGAGTLVSVKTIGTTRTPSSGTVTIANGAGSGNTVTITGCGSTVLTAGFGVIVETTTTLHTYAFHRLVPKATEVTTVAANAAAISTAATNVSDINNFYDLYQISTSAPTARGDSSSLQNGDLWFDSSSNKVLMIYDGSSGDGFTAATPNASDLVNINIVAGQLTYQEDLGLITNAVNSGSGNNSVNTVAGSISNVNTAATNIAKITTVADDLNEGTSEIDTVATNIANVNTVGNAISNVNSVAGSIANVNTVQGSISNVNTAATNISSINTTAASITNVNNFTDRYQVASSAPSTDGGGNSLAAGDLYFDTSANELKVYTGSAWQGGVTATGNFAATTGNTFTGSNIHNDNIKSIYGTSSDGMEIFHNASDSIINDTGTGSLKLQTGGSTKLEIVSTGVTVTGLVSATTIDGAAGDNLQLDFGSIA